MHTTPARYALYTPDTRRLLGYTRWQLTGLLLAWLLHADCVPVCW